MMRQIFPLHYSSKILDDKAPPVITIYGLDRENKDIKMEINDFRVYGYAQIPEKYLGEKKSLLYLDKKYKDALGLNKKITSPVNMKYIERLPGTKFSPILLPYVVVTFYSMMELKVYKKVMYKEGVVILEVDIEKPHFRLLGIKGISLNEWVSVPQECIKTFKAKDDKTFLILKRSTLRCWEDMNGTQDYDHSDLNIKYLFFDIESIDIPGDELSHPFMISLLYQETKNYDATSRIVLTVGDENIPEEIISNKGNTISVLVFDSVDTLIEAFWDHVLQMNVHFIGGHNILEFDFQRIKNITDKLKGKIKGTDIFFSEIKWEISTTRHDIENTFYIPKIPGVEFIDTLLMSRRLVGSNLASHSLGKLAEAYELSGKESITYKTIKRVLKGYMEYSTIKDINEFIHIMTYCFRDSELSSEIFHRMNGFDQVITESRHSRTSVTDLYTTGMLTRTNSIYYGYTVRKGVVVERVPFFKFDTEGTGGGIIDPIPGLYHDVVVLDVDSMYPVIIRDNNIDHTTLVRRKSSLDKLGIKYREFSFMREGQKSEAIFVDPETRKGIIPEIVDDFLEVRSTIKIKLKDQTLSDTDRKMLEVQSKSAKLVANSFYGSMWAVGGFHPLVEGALVITTIARDKILPQIENILLEEFDGKVIYKDTDSAFFQINNPSDKSTTEEDSYKKVDLGKIARDTVNSRLPDSLKVKLEGYGDIYIHKKKMYGRIDCDGQYIIKGFRGRNKSEWVSRTLEETVKLVLSEPNSTKARAEIKRIFASIYDKNVTIDILTLVKAAHQNIEDYKNQNFEIPMYAREMKKYGINIVKGTVMEYIRIRSDVSLPSGKKMIDTEIYNSNPSAFQDIDYNYYLDLAANTVDEIVNNVWGKEKYISSWIKAQRKLQ